MATFLFNELIFGPIKSRRLGNSLGINLLPLDRKICNFDCIYCECGWTASSMKSKMPEVNQVKTGLEEKLKELKEKNQTVDSITFAGNGEPTLHPQFFEIIEFTLLMRDRYFPEALVSVLSNASRIEKADIFKALNRVDQNILKLDSAIIETLHILNKPDSHFSLEKLIANLKKFEGNFILQTMFLRGKVGDSIIDNTTDTEIAAWLSVIEDVKPSKVMIYTINRDTPMESLHAVSGDDLNAIAGKLAKLGIEVQVSA